MENKDKTNENQTPQERDDIYRSVLKETESERISEEQMDSGVSEEQPKTSPFTAPPAGSLGKVKNDAEKKAELHEQNKQQLASVGWRKVDIANLPSEGKYNDATMRVKIRAATVEEIKHYSGLDETDLLDVSDHINEILNTCCRIEYADRIGYAANDLKEADKYYILFCIRDLTMDSHQKYHKLWQETQCPKCGKKSHNEITSRAFSTYKIPKGIAKHYDAIKRKLVIDHPAFGESLLIAPPSLGLTAAIQKYMQEHARKQQQAGAPIYFDAKFMMQLQYILDSPDQVNEAYLLGLQKKIGLWPHEKLTAFEHIRDNMDVGVRPHLDVVCRDTKSIGGNDEVGCKDDYSFSAPVNFRHGWRSVFDISGVIAGLFDADPE